MKNKQTKKQQQTNKHDSLCFVYVVSSSAPFWITTQTEREQKATAFSCLNLIKFNPFHPEFMKWAFLSLNLDVSFIANRYVKTEWQTM